VAAELADLAEDTAFYLPPLPTFDDVERDGYLYAASDRRASVHHVRLGDVAGALAWTRAETRRRGLERVVWWLGWNATPHDLGERLLAAGLEPDDVQPLLTGMVATEPPPASPVEVRRVETVEEYLAALEVESEVWGHEDADAERERRRFEAERGLAHQFCAYLDGRRVGLGRAIDGDGFVALMGGAVLPAARRRGVYRALVRARWDHAAGRGTPVLAVQAGAMSAPVLAGLGFRAYGEVRLYADRLRSGHGHD
jgi:ribosomal protein S18 acetylase RimI-like enzyme